MPARRRPPGHTRAYVASAGSPIRRPGRPASIGLKATFVHGVVKLKKGLHCDVSQTASHKSARAPLADVRSRTVARTRSGSSSSCCRRANRPRLQYLLTLLHRKRRSIGDRVTSERVQLWDDSASKTMSSLANVTFTNDRFHEVAHIRPNAGTQICKGASLALEPPFCWAFVGSRQWWALVLVTGPCANAIVFGNQREL